MKKDDIIQAPLTNWKVPTDGFTNKWIQCNQEDVDFQATLDDQFTHNLNCEATGVRKDGSGQTNIPASNFTYHAPVGNLHKVTLGSIQHGRQTITVIPEDSCDKGPRPPAGWKQFAWDTDLPGTFESKGFLMIWMRMRLMVRYG